MKRLSYRHERTLARPIEIEGIGFLKGSSVKVRLLPAPVATGVVFVRADLPGRPSISATVDDVTDTTRRTTLGRAPAGVTLVEHLLAALAGLRIDNCIAELDGPEPPGLDGSAQAFVDRLGDAGVFVQPRKKTLWTVDSPITVRQPGATLTLHPAEREELRISYFLDYGPTSPLGQHRCSAVISPERFAWDLASSRTFILENEAPGLSKQGLGQHLTPRDLLVIGDAGPIDNSFRYGDEPARHKILDVIGDLSLIGHGLCGHVVAYRSGHQLNIELARIVKQRLDVLTERRQRVA